MSSRRELLKLLGIAPMAATGGLAELKSTLASPAAIAAGAFSATMPEPGYPVATTNKFGAILGPKIERLNKLAEEERWARAEARSGRFDGDISSMKSTSLQTKQRLQLERLMEEVITLSDANHSIWGHW